jgi:ribonuclease BN (tRNA processing enzyme)
MNTITKTSTQDSTGNDMQFAFLGTGSAFTIDYFQSNAILRMNGKTLLIDAGGDIRRSLKAAGIALHELDAVYVTHLHSDHWGGAEYLAYGSFFNPAFVVNGSRRRLKVFAHPSVAQGLFDAMKTSTVLAGKNARLEDFFLVEHCSQSFVWQGVTFELIKTIHCMDNDAPMPCYGLTWKSPTGRTIWYSADALLDIKQPLLKSADVIFHDCETGFKTGVHAHYADLSELPAATKSKITLYHYNDGPKSDCVAAGFAGWAEQGLFITL